jgi:hypothetical protein
VGPPHSKSELIIRGQTPENIIRVAFNNDKGQMLRLVDYTYPEQDNSTVHLNYTDFTYSKETSKNATASNRQYGTAQITFDDDMDQIKLIQLTLPHGKMEMFKLDYDEQHQLITVNMNATSTHNSRKITVDAALLNEAKKLAKGPAVPI